MKHLLIPIFFLGAAIPALATTHYISTAGNDSNPGTLASPFATFNKCYSVSTHGDICMVQPGTYSYQSISPNGMSCTGTQTPTPANEVTFQSQSGPGTVTVGGIGVGSSCGITVQNMQVNGANGTGVQDIHFVGIASRGASFYFRNGSYLSFQQSDIGNLHASCSNPNGADKLLYLWGDAFVLLESSSWHDLTADSGCGMHPDTIEGCSSGCPGNNPDHDIIFRRNKFYNNVCDNARFGDVGDYNFTIENNWFGAVASYEGGCAQGLALTEPNAVIRFNTFQSAPYFPSSGYSSLDNGTVWDSNIFDVVVNNGACPAASSSGVIVRNNVWITGNPSSCNGMSQTVVSQSALEGGFVSVNSSGAAGPDLRITSNSPARGKGNSTSYPAVDIDGITRSAPVDAGGAQWAGATSVAPPSGLTATVQ